MSDERVNAVLEAISPDVRSELAAMIESEPVGRLFDGTIVRWIASRLGPILQGLTVEEITAFLVVVGVPQPWAGMLAQAIYAILHSSVLAED